MGREQGRHVCLPEPGHPQPDPRHPLVKVSRDPRGQICEIFGFLLRKNYLTRCSVEILTYYSKIREELSHHEAEDDDVVDLDVPVRSSNTRRVEQLLLELTHLVGRRSDIKEDDLRVTVHQPSARHYLVP